MVGRAILVVVALGLPMPWQPGGSAQCRIAGPLVRMPGLNEASGLAVSRRVPGRLWTHNDSGLPVLFALDTHGTVTARLRVSGAILEDWEAVAVGPCPAGSCLYIGDIGDNERRRKRITIYRLPEPDSGTESAAVTDVFHATYPDGPRDAEALLIRPDGRLSIVSKGGPGGGAVYRFPLALRSGATVPLERISRPREAGTQRPDERVTDGSVSPDGEWVVLRSKFGLAFYRTAELLAGTWREVRRVSLAFLGEPQGEGVAFGADNTIYLAGEGGAKGQAGTFTRLTCTPLGEREPSP